MWGQATRAQHVESNLDSQTCPSYFKFFPIYNFFPISYPLDTDLLRLLMLRRATGNLILFLLVALGSLAIVARAGAREDPSVILSESLEEDVCDGHLDQFRLLEAALIAGGIEDDAQLTREVERVDQFCADRTAMIRAEAQGIPRAACLLRDMHRILLTGPYRENCWKLSDTLDGGPYNCVTSTVLYICLCKEFQIPVTAVAEPGHVYCRIKDGRERDVQTTSARWLDQPDAICLAARRRNSTAVTDSPRELTDVQLLSKVAYNRAVMLLGRGHFRQAVASLRWACQMDPEDQSARKNLVSALNNWALNLCDVGRYCAASHKLFEGLELAPDDESLLANDVHIHQQWVLHLCQYQQHAEAVEQLQRCYQRRPDVKLFDKGRWTIYRNWSRSLAESGHRIEALSLLANARHLHPDSEELIQYELEVQTGSIFPLGDPPNPRLTRSRL